MLLNIVVPESENVGFAFNVKKTETIVITKSSLAPACEINIGHSSLKHVDKVKCLGTKISGDGKHE